MKNFSIIMILLSICSVQSLFSQRIYFSVNGGYGFTASSFVSRYGAGESTTTWSGNEFVQTTKTSPESFGKGIPLGLTAGYKINENVSFDLGATYLLGGTVTYHRTSIGTPSGSSSEDKNDIKSSSLQIIPAIQLEAGEDKIKLFSKFGIVLATLNNLIVTEYSKYDSKTINKESKMSSNLNLGYSNTFGIRYELSDNLSLTCEYNIVTLSFIPQKSIVTKWDEDGVDKLPSKTTSQKEDIYVTEQTYNSASTSQDPTKPDENLAFSMPFSRGGINVGVKFSF